MKTKIILSLFILAIFCCVYLMTSGCETSSAEENPVITPSAATIKSGQSIEFVASGGYEYKWSLEDNTIGTLSTYTGPRTVYRSWYDPGTSNNIVVQKLTVTSTITGAPSDTNGNSYVRTAEAYITHIPHK